MAVLWKALGLCVIGAILASALKKTSPPMALMVALGACVGALCLLAAQVERLASFCRQIMALTGMDETVFTPLVKILCVGIVVRVGSEICKDAEYNGAAAVVELTGAMVAVGVSIPLWEAVWHMVQSIL
ncbi:MAG: stage III sporulation protein AD [Oscillospiraceae bacterium]|nr:stage III sporulation protein AD [Oscillospiraceae bacterium]